MPIGLILLAPSAMPRFKETNYGLVLSGLWAPVKIIQNIRFASYGSSALFH